MEDIRNTIKTADEDTLTALSNRGIFKRAVKDIEGIKADHTEADGIITVFIGGEICTLTVPLENSTCTCVARGMCRHIMSAILYMKGVYSDGEEQQDDPPVPDPPPVPEPAPVPEPEQNSISETETGKIRECASFCLKLICGVLRRGLVRVPDTVPSDFEAAAVMCHTHRMADCERYMRRLSVLLGACIYRHANFEPSYFTYTLLECAGRLEALLNDRITPAALGEFREEYESVKGSLTLLPVGHRRYTAGGYTGNIYYFLSVTDKRFYSFSDVRRIENMRKQPSVILWGSGMTIDRLVRNKLTLAGAKVSGGKLSTSSECRLAAFTKAVPDCPELKDAAVSDFKLIARAVAGYDGISADNADRADDELERMFLIRINECISCGLNEYFQRYEMTVADACGSRVRVQVRCGSSDNCLTEAFEKSGKAMIKHPEKDHFMLVTAYIDNNELCFFPIEIFSFPRGSYAPPVTNRTEPEPDSVYCFPVSELINNIYDKLCALTECGLSSPADFTALISTANRYGMTSLSRLTKELSGAWDHYRHRLGCECEDILKAMISLNNYLISARRKLAYMGAACNMSIHDP